MPPARAMYDDGPVLGAALDGGGAVGGDANGATADGKQDSLGQELGADVAFAGCTG